jgi:hypothetical protein
MLKIDQTVGGVRGLEPEAIVAPGGCQPLLPRSDRPVSHTDGDRRHVWARTALVRLSRQRLRETLVVCDLAEALLTRVWDRISDSQRQLAHAEQQLASGRALLHGAKTLLSASAPPPQGCG